MAVHGDGAREYADHVAAACEVLALRRLTEKRASASALLHMRYPSAANIKVKRPNEVFLGRMTTRL